MRLGFLSDAHGNHHAFLQAIELLKKEAVDDIFFLGDSIGYFDGKDIPFYIRENRIKALRGNHEEMVLKKSVPREKEYIYRLKQHYDSDLVEIISAWPERFCMIVQGRKICMVHGSDDDAIWGYTYENTRTKNDSDLFVCGATHRPFVQKIEDRVMANVGSCGFPRDIGRQGSCGLYDTESHSFSILRFDISDSIEILKNTHQHLDEKILSIWERT